VFSKFLECEREMTSTCAAWKQAFPPGAVEDEDLDLDDEEDVLDDGCSEWVCIPVRFAFMMRRGVSLHFLSQDTLPRVDEATWAEYIRRLVQGVDSQGSCQCDECRAYNMLSLQGASMSMQDAMDSGVAAGDGANAVRPQYQASPNQQYPWAAPGGAARDASRAMFSGEAVCDCEVCRQDALRYRAVQHQQTVQQQQLYHRQQVLKQQALPNASAQRQPASVAGPVSAQRPASKNARGPWPENQVCSLHFVVVCWLLFLVMIFVSLCSLWCGVLLIGALHGVCCRRNSRWSATFLPKGLCRILRKLLQVLMLVASGAQFVRFSDHQASAPRPKHLPSFQKQPTRARMAMRKARPASVISSGQSCSSVCKQRVQRRRTECGLTGIG
jgi:hypothetical protein